MKLGVIEGFYGKTWSWQDREALLHFLSHYQFQHYIYAPKADIHLRNHWKSDWNPLEFNKLKSLSDKSLEVGLSFGLGLSPISLMEEWGQQSQQELKQRLEQIKLLKPKILAILFDDIQGDKANLAQLQIEISHFIQEQMPDTQLWVCPTYYSFDPVLPELFGTMPCNYWQALGENLNPSIELLWTGDKVISEHYSENSLENINQLLKRKVIIWDNSRVNDGRKTSPYLPIQAMPNFAEIEQQSSGVLINPMNQAHLAMLNLLTSKLEGTPEQRLQQAIQTLCGVDMAASIQTLLPLFRNVGLEGLTAAQQQMIQSQLADFDNAFAREIKAWLAGEYRFDPDCLT